MSDRAGQEEICLKINERNRRNENVWERLEVEKTMLCIKTPFSGFYNSINALIPKHFLERLIVVTTT